VIDHCIDMNGEESEFVQKTTVRAAKEHKCCECGNPILVGQEHEMVKGKWDGFWESYRTCRICAAVRADFFHSYIYGMLWDMMEQTYGLGYDTILEPGQYDRWDYTDEEWNRLVRGPIRKGQHRLQTRLGT